MTDITFSYETSQVVTCNIFTNAKNAEKTFFFEIIDTLKRPATREISPLPMTLLVVTLSSRVLKTGEISPQG